MYIHDRESWTQWAPHSPGAVPVVKQVLEQFGRTDHHLHDRIAYFLNPDSQGPSQCSIQVVRHRSLDFYRPLDGVHGPGWEPQLVEVELEPPAGRTIPPRLYILGIPRQAGAPHALHLDGSVSTLYYASQMLTGGIDLEKAATYFDFFSTFVAGEEGPLHVLRELEAAWVALPGREPHIGALLLARASLEYVPEGGPEEDFDDDKLRVNSEVQTVRHRLTTKITNLLPDPLPPLKIWPADSTFVKRLARTPADRRTLQNYIQDAKGSTDKRVFATVLQYGRQFFKVLLSIEQDGTVDIKEYQPIAREFGSLPLKTWQFREETEFLGGARSLELDEGKAEQPDINAFLSDAAAPPDQRDPPIGPSSQERRPALRVLPPFSGGRITKRIEVRGRTLHGPLEFHDTDFHEDVVFSDAVVEQGLTFRNCRFLGTLSLRNSRIGGPLILENCTVEGLRDRQRMRLLRRRYREQTPLGGIDETVALDLGGLRVAGDLRIERVKANGTVTLRGIRVEGRSTINGCQIWPFHQRPEWTVADDADKKLRLGLRFAERGAALDLRSGRFEQGLSLSAWFDPSVRLHQARLLEQATCWPTLVVGTIRAEHVSVGESLELSGLICTDLDDDAFRHVPERTFSGQVSFTDARIGGSLHVWSTSEGPNDGWKYLRTIMATLDLRRAHFNAGDLRGLYLSEDLSGRALQCDGILDFSPIGLHWIDSFPDSFAYWTAPDHEGRPLLALPPDALQADGLTVARFGRTQIGGNMDLRASVVKKDIYLDGIHVGRDINLNDADIGGLNFSVHVSFFLGSEDSEVYTWFDKSDPPLEHGPLAHLRENDLACMKFPRREEADTVAAGMGGVVIGAQARRLLLRDAIVRGPVKLAGGLLMAEYSTQAARQKMQHVLRSDASRDEVLNQAPSPNRPEEDKQGDDALVITNTTIEGPLALYREELFNTLVARILRNPDDRMAAGQVVPAEDAAFLPDRLERLLRQWLPIAATSARIMGGVRVHETQVDGQLELRRAVIYGRLVVVDVELKSDLRAHHPAQGMFAFEVDLESLKTPGDVFLDGLCAHNVHARGMRIGGRVMLNDAKVKQTVTLEALCADSDVRLNRLEAGALEARNMVVGGRIEMNGVRILGSAVLADSKCDKLEVTIPESKQQGTLDIQRCKIDILTLGDPIPNRIDPRTSQIGRIEATGGRSTHAIVEELLFKKLTEFDANVFAMFANLLESEGDVVSADKVRRELQKERLARARDASGVRSWEYLSRWMFNAFGVLGRAFLQTSFVGVLTVLVSWVFLTGSVENWDLQPGQEVSAGDSFLAAVEVGFPPFSPVEGEDLVMQPRKTGSATVGLDLVHPGLATNWDRPYWFTPRTLAKVLRAVGWVVWSWFLLLATGLMRRSGGTVAE